MKITKFEWNSKILVILFALSLIGSFNLINENFSTKVNAESINSIHEDYEWITNEDNTITITRYKGSDSHIIIPSDIDGKAVTVLDDYAFNTAYNEIVYGEVNYNVTSVYIPSSVKSIGQAVFTRNPLETIEVDPTNSFYKDIDGKGLYTQDEKTLIQGTISGQIQEGTEKIGDHAFLGMGLTNIDIPDSVTTIGLTSFYDNEISDLTIGSNTNFDSTFRAAVAFGKNPLQTIRVDSDNVNYKDIDGKGMYTKDGKQLLLGTSTGEVAEGTELIHSHAFYFTKGLTKVDIPSSVRKIEDMLLFHNTLKDVFIRSKDTVINLYEFGGSIVVFFEMTPRINKDITIYSYENSAAKEYTDQWGFTFSLLNVITGVEPLTSLEVEYGTTEAALHLPNEVLITLSDNSKKAIQVNWNTSTFDGNKAGTYTITGELVLNDELNPQNVEATILVTVKPPLADGWKIENGKWVYIKSGVKQTGWVLDNGTWYYLGADRYMKTGWFLDKGIWYYLQSNGAMKTGWLLENGTWYYLDKNGAMKTGWFLNQGTWYFLEKSGTMKTGWFLDNGSWYFLNSSGTMVTGWQKVGGLWYYFYSGGQMAYNTSIGGYKLNSSGVWVQ